MSNNFEWMILKLYKYLYSINGINSILIWFYETVIVTLLEIPFIELV
jgi:hypothetical protein